MNCGMSDHPNLETPANCPRPPATDEFVMNQVKKIKESSDEIPEDDNEVKKLIKRELNGLDPLTLQLNTVVPGGDLAECIW